MSRRYKWIHHNGTTFYNVGITPDGLLHNPNHYPDDDVQDAIKFVEALRLERRKRAAKKAAETRRARREKKIYQVVAQLSAHNPVGPRTHCAICGRHLDDPQSIDRGIGSECWQTVMRLRERAIDERNSAAACVGGSGT